nr:alpha/beta hydrolase [Govania unica]
MASTEEISVPTRSGPVRVRLYSPQSCAEGLSPALLYLHGGGWTYFSLETHDRVMREYAERAGVIVVGIDYPLAPEAKFPVALEAIVDVTEWLYEHGDEHGIDVERMISGGDSAGANLTMGLCQSLRDSGKGDVIKGMLLIYGAFQKDCSDEAHRKYGGPGYMLGSDEMAVFWGNYIKSEDDVRNPLLSSMYADVAGLPPAFFTIPECDVLSEQSYRMAEKLERAGVAATQVTYKGASHSFLEAISIAEIAERAVADSAAWVRQIVRS